MFTGEVRGREKEAEEVEEVEEGEEGEEGEDFKEEEGEEGYANRLFNAPIREKPRESKVVQKIGRNTGR